VITYSMVSFDFYTAPKTVSSTRHLNTTRETEDIHLDHLVLALVFLNQAS
jgi:hypothetical protein